MSYKVDNSIKLQYLALNKVTGLTDITLKTYNPSGTLVDTTVLTEASAGLYETTFIPNVIGFWRITIVSALNGDSVQKQYQVESADLNSIAISIETIDANILEIKEKTGNLPSDTASELTYLKDKIDDISSKVNTGGYIL